MALYQEEGISRKPKALDLSEFFEVREVLLYEKNTGKRDKGLEILGIKER